MSPKEKRDRLFKKDRPYIRPLKLYENGQYSKDIARLWVAYKKGGFPAFDQNLSEEEFALTITDYPEDVQLFLADDHNKAYGGVGPIALFSLSSNGWKFEPHVKFLPWATVKNKLRSTVAFLQWLRYSKEVGCIWVYSTQDSVKLFDKCKQYGVLYFSGKVFCGDETGDVYIYSVKGKKDGR